MTRPASQIRDVVDADIWVMDPQTLYGDEVYALRDYELYRVRSVPGVAWAVPLYKGLGRAKSPDGKFRTVILMGVDDATLVGAPRKMLLGSIDSLRQPDGTIIDKAGYQYFFPGNPPAGRPADEHRRVLIVGISDASRRSELLSSTPGTASTIDANVIALFWVSPQGVSTGEACQRIKLTD
jgi:putative ABC transport system permease protein